MNQSNYNINIIARSNNAITAPKETSKIFLSHHLINEVVFKCSKPQTF